MVTDVVDIGVLDNVEDGEELVVVTGGEDVVEDIAEVADVELVPVVLEVNTGTTWPPPILDGIGPTEVTSLAALW